MGYRNTDIESLARVIVEALIAQGSTDDLAQESTQQIVSDTLAAILGAAENTVDHTRATAENTARVPNSQLKTKFIVNDTNDLSDLRTPFDNWKTANPLFIPVFITYMHNNSDSFPAGQQTLLINYIDPTEE